MNKSVKRIGCLVLAAAMAFPLAACKGCKGKTKNDPETRPVVFATEALDGNFNPFFATSAPDSEMANMTQLGMLTTDANGNILCGENEPTVVLDYTETVAADKSKTEYEFVIKNGIKFSNGTDLTIKDVLFNLYVYLDPAYMGSATMYSTDIQGLRAYRLQDPEAADDADESTFNSQFVAKARERMSDIVAFLDGDNTTTPAREEEEIKADIETIKELFREELESDWTMAQGSLEGYEDEYTFTESWQIFYLNEGIIKVASEQGKPLREKPVEGAAKGKYVTNITKAGVTLDDGSTYDGKYYNADLIEEIENAQKDEAALKAYTDKGASAEDAKTFVTRDFAIDTVHRALTTVNSSIIDILNFWATGANLLDKFVAEARTAAYEDLKEDDGSLKVKNISGISTYKTADGKNDVLKIVINKIDPKAIYNFAFAVAPMNYYSGTFEGVDYVKAAMEDTENVSNFGVAFNNNKFFETILQDDEKNAKPVGAGAYQVSNDKYETGDAVDGDEFYSNNWVYFARNDYFETVGEEIENAKIKYLHYKVVNSDNLLQALEAGDIDVGEPNATATNISKIAELSDILNQRTVDTNGYGYVGINPKYVPDIQVRQAIMSAMDTIHCLNYYTSANASLIYRSMSKASWIWSKGGDEGKMPTSAYHPLVMSPEFEEKYPEMKDMSAEDRIVAMVGDAGWKKNADGILAKGNETLKLTFTIAGATTDHPAYTMFSKAEEFLEGCGFDITVTTDISALKKLATGQLQVWAAAWSSTVDPDMYQVYHKDSNATSVKNWGYETIFADTTGQFADEQTIINELSELIEKGRETNIQEERAPIYKEALDLVMDLAVEMPTYQRKDCVAYNKNVIDAKSLNQNPTPFAGVIDKVWELAYV